MHVILIHLKPVCISRIFELAYVNLVLGQGMNASMNDSHNLGARLSYISLKKKTFPNFISAWKLTHVLRGWAKLALLKTVNLILLIYLSFKR